MTQKKGDNVTLACTQVREEDQLGSIVWYKDDILQVSQVLLSATLSVRYSGVLFGGTVYLVKLTADVLFDLVLLWGQILQCKI